MRGQRPNFRDSGPSSVWPSVSTPTLGPLTGRSTGLRPSVASCLFGLVLGLGHHLAHSTFCLFIDSTGSIRCACDRLGHFRPMLFFDGVEGLSGLLFDLSKLTFGYEVSFRGHAISFDAKFAQCGCRTNFGQ